ncbi:MAG: phospholipid carrier-dependent glycosyltransferase [Chloroflexi bacterium]|nr:phospholipid carrier-dependent glycosyltransferase [Chloroflexota bacterium]
MSFRWRLGLLALAFALLATTFSFAIPLYEAPDETIHLDYVIWLREGRGLPVMTGDPTTTPGGQEAFHPPLYYALAALFTLPADPTGYREAQRVNWYQQFAPDLPGNKHVMVRPPGEHPFQPPLLALHLARLASVLCGVATVVLTALVARLAGLGEELALLAAALVAALPQFVFLSAVTNADSAVIAASTATLASALWLLQRPLSLPRALLLGGTAGLAAVSKGSGVLVVALATVVLGMALLAGQGWRQPRRCVAQLLCFAVGPTMLAGWWFARNFVLYGELLGWQQLNRLAAALVRQELTLPALLQDAAELRTSSWALFGWGNVALPEALYFGFDGLLLLAGLGWVLHWRRPRPGLIPTSPALVVLLLWLGAFLGALVRWAIAFEHAAQGRLWFPALTAFSILVVSGLAQLFPRVPTLLPGLGVGGLASVAGLALPLVILPAYAAPVPPAEPPPTNVRATFGEAVELLGYRFVPERAAPGEFVTLQLWWRAHQPLTRDAAIQLRLLARDFRPVATMRSYPAAGTRPFDWWQPGEVVFDPHTFRLPRTVEPPDYLRLELGILDRGSGQLLPVRDAAGRPVGTSVTLAPLRVPGGSWPPGGTPMDLELPGTLTLASARMELAPPEGDGQGPTLTLLLAWVAARPLPDARATLRLVTPGGAVIVAGEQPLGSWHRASDWRAGDRFVDELDFSLPAGLLPGPYDLWLDVTGGGQQASARLGKVGW